MKYLLFAVACATVAVPPFPAEAHDYWLQPERLVIMNGRTLAVRLYVGEDFIADEEKPFETARTPRLEVVAMTGTTDLRGVDHAPPFARFAATDEGGYLLACDRTAASIELAPAKFESYVRDEGLDWVIAERARRGEATMPGRERYSRSIKAFVQVGTKRDGIPSRETHQELEILLLEHPHVGSLPVRVLFRGTPLASARVGVVKKGDGEIGVTTDSAGLAQVPISSSGPWLIRMVQMVRCEGCDGIEWRSYWSSYAFGIAETDLSPPDQLQKRTTRSNRSRVPFVLAAIAVLAALAIALRTR